MELIHSGKVREVYADGDDLLLVASDRISIYDVVLPTPVPGKGRVLTQLSLWWFDRLGDIVPNHVISATDVPQEWAGRAIRCQRLEMVPVECIARGYLAGLGLTAYNETGAVSGRAPAAWPRRGVEAAGAGVHAHHEGGRGPRRADDLRRGDRPGRRRTRRKNCGGSPWRSTGAAPTWPPSAASSWRTPSWSSAGRRTARSSWPTRYSPLTHPASGLPIPTPLAARSTPSTSSTCATGRRRSAGTAPQPGPEIPADVLGVLTARYAELFEKITGQPAPVHDQRRRAVRAISGQ